MKKKNFLAAMALLTTVCVLLVTACPDDDNGPGEKPKHTDPAFLVGTWTKDGGASFTIANDLTFVCQITVPGLSQLAQISGSLDATTSGLGPNDYFLKNMATSGEASEFPGNGTLVDQLPGFQNLHVTLTPNTAKTEFTFSSSNFSASFFFGGKYTKQQP